MDYPDYLPAFPSRIGPQTEEKLLCIHGIKIEEDRQSREKNREGLDLSREGTEPGYSIVNCHIFEHSVHGMDEQAL